MKILVTGSAGFIGFHLSKKLLEKGIPVIGFDNLNEYYDINLKLARVNILKKISQEKKVLFQNINGDLSNINDLEKTFDIYKPEKVVNLAAQAGVRYSLIDPNSYIHSNLVGFANILELSKRYKVRNLIFASSSSVYGLNSNIPFYENQNVDHPISLYAATKKSNELMAHAYSHLYKIPITGLRFFTVYGPWGRPDMALFLFTKAILENKPIQVFNNGEMIRDFTFIDDVVESLSLLLEKPAKANSNFDTYNPDPSSSLAPFKIFNIGNSKPVKIDKYIEAIELALNKKAQKEYLDIQPGDVAVTSSNCDSLNKWIGFSPSTSIQEGVNKFIEWYRDFYKV